jgi:hypothetical protein
MVAASDVARTVLRRIGRTSLTSMVRTNVGHS